MEAIGKPQIKPYQARSARSKKSGQINPIGLDFPPPKRAVEGTA